MLLASVSVGAVLAGEVTGNGKLTPIGATEGGPPHASSICSFSGQEDLQFFINDESTEPKPGGPTKGDPAHAQAWGQIPKEFRDPPTGDFHPGNSCNGHTGFFSGGGE
jgi:hypothetical protein